MEITRFERFWNFLQPTETELQTETEISRQKIMSFPQLLR